MDIAAARAVGAAREELRRAARHLRRKEMTAAADAVERALALAPELPEKLAADLKRLAGDTEGAQARYRRYLDLGATTREDEEEARAFVP